MPPIPESQMTAEQRAAAAEVAAGRRGALIGPFIPSLRSPEFMRRLQGLGEFLRYDNALGPRLSELLILLVARQWTQQFEWYVHAPIARQSGVGEEVIAAVAQGRRPLTMTEDQAI